MRIIYNNLLPLPGYSAMMLFGTIFARLELRPLSAQTINHEAIHKAQAEDCKGYFAYYLRYIVQWLKCGYRDCPFEREAYANDDDMQYLEGRQPKAWRAYK